MEYDCDEEDAIWLRLVNEERRSDRLPPVPLEDVEFLLDRLEKESFMYACQLVSPGDAASSSLSPSGGRHSRSEDETVCCICNDGECQNANAIIFCDSCDIPVHQGCYGVPYIPEGTWLCQRCSQAPKSTVR